MTATETASAAKGKGAHPVPEAASVQLPDSDRSDASDASDDETDEETAKFLKSKAGKRAVKKHAKKIAKKAIEKQKAAAAAAVTAAATSPANDGPDKDPSDNSGSSDDESGEPDEEDGAPSKGQATTYKLPSERPDFHKNIKWVREALKDIDKLNTKNWYTWNPRFLDAIRVWPEAAAHLLADEQQDEEKFDAKLDLMLVIIVQGACQTTGLNNINFALARPKDTPSWRLNSLYFHLEDTLLKTEKLNKPELLRQVSAIRMMNSDVRKLVSTIREHWAKADSMGYPLSEDLKIQTLTTQARFNLGYSNAIDSLEVNGNAADFEFVAGALMLKQDRQALRMPGRVPGSGNTTNPPVVSGSIRNAEANVDQANSEAGLPEINSAAYWRGKRGPNGEPAVCYHCLEPGHLIRNCPSKHLPPKRRNQVNDQGST